MGRGIVLCGVIAGASFAGGCATPGTGYAPPERGAAMDRWSRCVGRHAETGDTTVDAIDAVRERCDGHRRDVAHTFPPHLESRVAETLVRRERADVLGQRADRAASEAGAAADARGSGAGDALAPATLVPGTAAPDAAPGSASGRAPDAAPDAVPSQGRRLRMRLDTLLLRFTENLPRR